jgi:EAL domain-containing protein (putative c-di-GMP-specific phosphodiesterase class I)
LRDALDHNQLELHFQPKLNLSTGLIDAAEGLVRWPHPRLGNVPPSQILLEVTESAVMGKPEAAIRVLRQLADRGIDLAIDDFGVGQSSFAYLRQFPVSELKIDKVFTQRIADAPEDRTIVRSIVELGHHLGYKVTAEGVDKDETLRFLAQVGCDHAQGFLIARALPAESVERMIDSREWIGIADRRSA